MRSNHPTNHRATAAALAAFTFLGVALAGCTTDGAQAASVDLYVKDAVTDHYTEVHVTYTRADVLPEGADAWVVAFEGEETIELLSLSDSTAKEKLGTLSVEPGSYEGLRIAISAVEAIDHNGTSYELTVIGDLLQISESFEVTEDGDLAILVDFDLEESIDPEAGTFQAQAANVQTSDDDSDGDNVTDIDDADDDNDGLEDAQDDDIDGDNQTDRPAQSVRGYFGLCTAWMASETGRENGNSSQSQAFQRLEAEAANASQTLEAFCDAQQFPGRSEHIPERAQQARQEALERREAARENAGGNQTRGPPEDRPGNATDGPGAPGGAGRAQGPPADDEGARDPDA